MGKKMVDPEKQIFQFDVIERGKDEWTFVRACMFCLDLLCFVPFRSPTMVRWIVTAYRDRETVHIPAGRWSVLYFVAWNYHTHSKTLSRQNEIFNSRPIRSTTVNRSFVCCRDRHEIKRPSVWSFDLAADGARTVHVGSFLIIRSKNV